MKGRKCTSKRILVLSTSLRIGGNSKTLADIFIKGAEEAGHGTKKTCLYDKKIEFCKDCLGCQTTGECILHDDAEGVIAQTRVMDVLVSATPVYSYEMSGQAKTLLDRTNSLLPAGHEFRDIYLLATSADEEESSMEVVVKGPEGQISCFEESHLAGVVCGTGADKKGAIEECGEALPAVYEMGRNIQKEVGVISLVTTMPVAAIVSKQ